jgi:hypothetical protein
MVLLPLSLGIAFPLLVATSQFVTGLILLAGSVSIVLLSWAVLYLRLVPRVIAIADGCISIEARIGPPRVFTLKDGKLALSSYGPFGCGLGFASETSPKKVRFAMLTPKQGQLVRALAGSTLTSVASDEPRRTQP